MALLRRPESSEDLDVGSSRTADQSPGPENPDVKANLCPMTYDLIVLDRGSTYGIMRMGVRITNRFCSSV